MGRHDWETSKHDSPETMEVEVCTRCHVEQVEVEYEELAEWGNSTCHSYVYVYRLPSGAYLSDEPACECEEE